MMRPLDSGALRFSGVALSAQGGGAVGSHEIGPELIERWALAYLGRYASSAGTLRQILLRRVKRRGVTDRAGLDHAAALIEALILRYCDSGLVDDEAFAAGRAQSLHRRGEAAQSIRARLRAKGVTAETTAAAIAGLRDAAGDPDLAAACIFARRRRLGPYRRGTADRARDLAAFARNGFSRAIAEAVLACADVDAVEALARDGLG